MKSKGDDVGLFEREKFKGKTLKFRYIHTPLYALLRRNKRAFLIPIGSFSMYKFSCFAAFLSNTQGNDVNGTNNL